LSTLSDDELRTLDASTQRVVCPLAVTLLLP